MGWPGTCCSRTADFNAEVLPRFGLVHRIDKNTSGLMVLAKTEKAVSSLAKEFFNHTIHRQYVALVWGDVAEDEWHHSMHISAGTSASARSFDAYPDGE